MKLFNKKVVKYDGDIPMEELIRLQEKLKVDNQQYGEKPQVSFITDK